MIGKGQSVPRLPVFPAQLVDWTRAIRWLRKAKLLVYDLLGLPSGLSCSCSPAVTPPAARACVVTLTTLSVQGHATGDPFHRTETTSNMDNGTPV
jgi:hypothetical protein